VAREALEYVLPGFLLSKATILPFQLRRGMAVGLTMVVSAILGWGAPDRLFVLVGAKDSIEVVIIVIRRRPCQFVSRSPLLLEVPQYDISLLGIPRITLRTRGIRVMSGEPILRGMSEQSLSKSDKTLFPAVSTVQLLRNGELLGLVGSLLPGSPPPAHQEDQEDKSASEGHEKNLPPLESAGTTLCGCRGVDAGDTGQRRDVRCSRWVGNYDKVGQTNAHPGDKRCTTLAACVDA